MEETDFCRLDPVQPLSLECMSCRRKLPKLSSIGPWNPARSPGVSSRAAMEESYRSKVAQGLLSPAPDDFSGWRMGSTLILAASDQAAHWKVADPQSAVTFDVCHEAVLHAYAEGRLHEPSTR